MDTDQCPKCNAKAVVTGRTQRGVEKRVGFEPTGMRSFNFRLWEAGVICALPVRACLACGHVWTHLKPEELRTFIDNYGTAETKLKLAPFRKGPPEQDLV
jgi:hypothetical protein